jgi:hypothetical protein
MPFSRLLLIRIQLTGILSRHQPVEPADRFVRLARTSKPGAVLDAMNSASLIWIAEPGRGSRPARWHVWAALAVALIAGLILRAWAFDHTADIRSVANQTNAFYWGDRIVAGARQRTGQAGGAVGWIPLWHSYLAVYEDDAAHPAPDAHTLDYAPLRLLMAGVWVNHVNAVYGPSAEWRPEFARSFAAFSTVTELAGAAAMFWLVAAWTAKKRPLRCFEPRSGLQIPRYTGAGTPDRIGPRHSPPGDDHPGRWPAAVAAILLWLDPSGIIDSHVCPQGESWIFAAYLLAVLAMMRGRFFTAGILLGVAAMFKGQVLLVGASVFLGGP